MHYSVPAASGRLVPYYDPWDGFTLSKSFFCLSFSFVDNWIFRPAHAYPLDQFLGIAVSSHLNFRVVVYRGNDAIFLGFMIRVVGVSPRKAQQNYACGSPFSLSLIADRGNSGGPFSLSSLWGRRYAFCHQPSQNSFPLMRSLSTATMQWTQNAPLSTNSLQQCSLSPP